MRDWVVCDAGSCDEPFNRDWGAMVALSSSQDERVRQRRLRAAESQRYGYGGVSAVSVATDMSQITIAQGIREQEEETHLPGRVRRMIGRRKALTTTAPTLREDLGRWVALTTWGDPESHPLR